MKKRIAIPKFGLKKAILACLLLCAVNTYSTININVATPPDRLENVSTYGNGSFVLSPVFLVASVSSNSNHYIIEKLDISVNTSKAIFYSNALPSFWVWRRGSPGYGDFTQPAMWTGMNIWGHMAPDNTNAGTYDVFVRFAFNPTEAHCEKVWINFTGTFINDFTSGTTSGEWGKQNGSGTCNIFFSRYTNNWGVYNSTDLFVKDDDKDLGEEPYYPVKGVDASVSLLNSLTGPVVRRYNGINPTLAYSNYAQRSTLGAYNYMNVWVENRGCVNSTSPAQVELFWTINRTFEPWSKDWFNYSSNSFAASNYVYYPAMSTTKQPAGNQITIADKNNYASANLPLAIPAGITPSKADPGGNYTGGFLSAVQWNAPDPNWYFPTASSFHWHSLTKVEPVICFLAVVTEPSKVNDGFAVPAPRATSNIHVSGYAINNNNVAMVNSYLATPTPFYKNAVVGSSKFRSNTGSLIVNNPYHDDVINIKIKGDQITQDFYNNGSIYLVFDDVLWQRWLNGSNIGTGSGFEIMSSNVLKLTNPDLATLTNIHLDNDEQGMLGIMFEYEGATPPQSDYTYGLTLGAYDAETDQFIGESTYFSTLVLQQPQAESTGPVTAARTSEVTGVSTIEPDVDFLSVFPNPVNDRLTISYYLNSDSKVVSVEVFDIIGRKVQSESATDLKKGKQDHFIDVSGLAPGNYMVKLTIDGNYRTMKIVK